MKTTLENGLKVLLLEDHSAPVVALNVWVRTGSADETESEAGMAHVFEHMLFKGTERRAVGEIAHTVEAAGGNINAFTSFDMTVYHITMARRDAHVGIDVLADAVQHSTFDPNELDKEKEVVVEEIRRSDDSPGRVLSQDIFAEAYARHPYRRPVIGTRESVRSFSREQILDFHRRWYVPNNMTFIAVGDLDPDAALEQIRTAFADATPRPDLAHPREAEPRRTAPRAKLLRRDFEQTLVGIAWPITAFAEPDTAYLDLLSMILGSGDTSRLYRSVKDRLQLVHTIGASAYTPLDAGLFFVDAMLEPEKLETAVEAIGIELERLRAFGPSEREVERARVNLLAGEIHEKETMQGQARKLGYYETLAGGLEAEEAYLERVRRATPEDIRRVAQEYLVGERATLIALLPKEARPELEAGPLLASLRAAEEAPRALSREEIEPGILKYRLPNGLRVVVKRNASVPLVSMRLSFLGGQLVETEETQGLSAFVASMLDRGTEQRSAAQLAAEVEGIAGSLEGFSGRNSVGVSAEFLKESLDTGIDLFADVVLHAAFPEEEIEKVRTEKLAAIKRREDSLATKAFELFAGAVYAEHPYRFPTIGSEDSVKRIDREALRAYYDRYRVPANGVLGIVGDVDPDAVLEAFATYFTDWNGAEEVTFPERRVPGPPTAPREVSIEKNKQQVHIVVGFPGLALDDPDQPALEVLTQILSGQGGRLFMELRDRQSLAYSVSAFSIEGVDPGSFGVYIASAPDKLEEALEGVRTELGRILDEPIGAEEFERAKAYLIGSQAVSLQRFGLQASLLSLDELYGLGATHHLGYGDRIAAVSIDDVRRVAGRLIHLDAPVVALVR